MEKIKYALFFDIDGTLTHRHRVTKRTVRMLNKARLAGHFMFINTGRSRGFLPEYLLSKTAWDGFVCGGGYAELHGKVIMDERLDKNLVEKLCRFSEKEKLHLILEGIDNCYTLNFRRNHFILLHSADEAIACYDEMKITKITFMHHKLSEEQIKLFENDLNIIQMPTYTEAYKKGFSKANGIKAIAKELNLNSNNIISFGDSKNDYEMLQDSAIRVVMKQAPKEIKALATIVTKSRLSGAAEGIRRLKLHRKQ